uniref:WGS project CAEQ00000000 data, annotated contig 899 n=1 Tax=Trypanosoma congolense (strain IL3000) TaxID=1068625 RepID=F9WJD5_TRYCI|nr:unnamed protein product [Trypanosoma congolense IL3000]
MRGQGVEPPGGGGSIDLLVECTAHLRPYQRELFEKALYRDSIIYLPTGGGKTVVAAAMAVYMNKISGKRVVFVVDRIVLVDQQAAVLRHAFGDNSSVETVSGPKKSVKNWNDFMYSSAGALVIINSIFYEWISVCPRSIEEDVCLVIVDEVHHARGGFGKMIMDFIHERAPREQDVCADDRNSDNITLPVILGLTASPFISFKNQSSLEELIHVTQCRILRVTEELNSLRSSVPLPLTLSLEYCLAPQEDAFMLYLANSITIIQRHSIVQGNKTLKHACTFSATSQAFINKYSQIREHALKCRDKVNLLEYAVSTFFLNVSAALIKLSEGTIYDAYNIIMNDSIFECIGKDPDVAMLVTPIFDGLVALMNEMRRKNLEIQRVTREGPVPRDGRLTVSSRVQFLLQLLKWIANHVAGVEESIRAIVFCETRACVYKIVEEIESVPCLRDVYMPLPLVGRGSSFLDGEKVNMTDAKQKGALKAFRQGEARLLVATSVCEEGMDVAQCNLVIRFDSCVSLSSFIQSRGRARRKNALFIILEHVFRKVKVASVAMKALRLGEILLDNVCCPFRTGGNSPQRPWEELPALWLRLFERRHGTVITRVEERMNSNGNDGVQWVCRLRVTVRGNCVNDGGDAVEQDRTFCGEGVGSIKVARKLARQGLCEKLDDAQLLFGPDGGSASGCIPIRGMADGIYYCGPEGIDVETIQEAVGGRVQRLTSYDEKIWGRGKPSVALRELLRRRGLPQYEIKSYLTSEPPAIGIVVCGLRGEVGVKEFKSDNPGSPLEEAAFKALDAMNIVFMKCADGVDNIGCFGESLDYFEDIGHAEEQNA